MVDILHRLELFGREQSHPAVTKVHAGSGIIRVYYKLDSAPHAIQAMADHINSLRIHLKNFRGTVVLESGPASLKNVIDVWGYDFKDKIWMQKIRNQFDPNEVLNPGRYVV
jgi:FAD/FMN-containing dehydrogenase